MVGFPQRRKSICLSSTALEVKSVSREVAGAEGVGEAFSGIAGLNCWKEKSKKVQAVDPDFARRSLFETSGV